MPAFLLLPPTTICQLYVTWHTLACATYATLDTSMCICICHLVHITQACDAYATYIHDGNYSVFQKIEHKVLITQAVPVKRTFIRRNNFCAVHMGLYRHWSNL